MGDVVPMPGHAPQDPDALAARGLVTKTPQGRKRTLGQKRTLIEGLHQDPDGVWRDRHDRPCLQRADGGGRAPYLRPSQIGDEMDDKDLITLWRLRQVAKAVTFNTHLQTDIRAHWRNRGHMNRITKEAEILAKSGARASQGTAEHHFFDDVDLDRPTDRPPELDLDVEAYLDLTVPRFEHLHIEQFCACDTEVAGLPVYFGGRPDRISRLLRDEPLPKGWRTADGLNYVPAGSCVVVDNKTGQSVDYAQIDWGLQLGIYSHSVPYDTHTDTRFEWAQAPRTDLALIMHAPYGEGTARLHWIDIGTAWIYLAIAIARRDARSEKDKLMAPVPKAHVIRTRGGLGDW